MNDTFVSSPKPAGMALIDAHIHTAGISLCSRIPPARLLEICRIEGLQGIVLTNHYKSDQIRGEFKDWRSRYVEEFEITRELGRIQGVKVFLGVEVTPDEQRQNDFLLYGLKEQDILEAEPLCHLPLTELYTFAHEKGALLYHAHPYRNTKPADPNLLDGVEINCHPLYRTCAEERVRAFAKQYGLRLSCGSDYHGDTYKAHCGIWIPETITNGLEFASYLKNTPEPKLLIAPDPAPDAPVGPGCGGVL